MLFNAQNQCITNQLIYQQLAAKQISIPKPPVQQPLIQGVPVQLKKGKRADLKRAKTYIKNALIANNSGLIITSMKKNKIYAKLNNTPITIRISVSKNHYCPQNTAYIYSWSKCSLNDLKGISFHIFLTECSFGNGNYGFRAVLFNIIELNNFITLKTYTGNYIHFGFKWDHYGATTVNDIRERRNILQATKYDADLVKKWVLV